MMNENFYEFIRLIIGNIGRRLVEWSEKPQYVTKECASHLKEIYY